MASFNTNCNFSFLSFGLFCSFHHLLYQSLRQATEVKATNASLDIMASVSAEVGAELLAEAGNQTDGLGDVSCPFCSRVFASTSSMRIHASLKHWRAARPAATIQQPGLVSVGFGPTGQLGHFSALSAAAAAAAAAASAAAATCQQQPLQHEGRFIITSANSAAAAVVARQSHLMQLQQQQPSQQISIDFASAGHGLANLGIVGTNSVPAISGQVASGGILPLATPTVYPCLPCHIGFGRRLGLRGHLVRVHGISRRSVDSYIDSIISRSVGLSLPSGELVLSGQTPSVLAAPAISCSTSTSTAFAISAASSSTSSISSLSLPIESGIVGLGANVLAGLNDPGPLHSVLTGSLCSASGGAINQAVVSAATTTAASAAVSASLVMALNELEATAATSAGSQAGLIAVTTTDGENGNREVMRSGVPCSVIDEATSVGLRTAGVSDIPPSPSRVPRALAH
ncbi:unnamed protein product [Protopolystoma xenopodis]|uniref:C2H2-type domain-containing protein n=1 Tax=Protopolystoma xenopodis TaxID=117903 RepID=A0A3S5CE34_9PLAT|nr:unnamed protein product [Protopolystoma xenopodis]